MPSDERLLQGIQQSLGQAQMLADVAHQHLASAQALQAQWQASQATLETSLRQSESSLQTCLQKLNQLELNIQTTLESHGADLNRLQSHHHQLQPTILQSQAQLDQALLGYQAARHDLSQEIERDLSQARLDLQAVQDGMQTTSLKIVTEVTRLQQEVARVGQGLRKARQELTQQADQTMAAYPPLKNSLQQGVQQTQSDSAHGQTESGRSATQIVENTAQIATETLPPVSHTYKEELAAQVNQLSLDLGAAVEQLQTVSRSPRQLADHELLAMMQKLRETLQPLEHISKVYRTAQRAGLC